MPNTLITNLEAHLVTIIQQLAADYYADAVKALDQGRIYTAVKLQEDAAWFADEAMCALEQIIHKDRYYVRQVSSL